MFWMDLNFHIEQGHALALEDIDPDSREIWLLKSEDLVSCLIND